MLVVGVRVPLLEKTRSLGVLVAGIGLGGLIGVVLLLLLLLLAMLLVVVTVLREVVVLVFTLPEAGLAPEPGPGLPLSLVPGPELAPGVGSTEGPSCTSFLATLGINNSTSIHTLRKVCNWSKQSRADKSRVTE